VSDLAPLHTWQERSAWEGVFATSAPGETSAGVVVAPRDGLAIASVMALRDQREAASRIATSAYGIALPTTSHVVHGTNCSFGWNGPDSWLAVATTAAGFVSALERSFVDIASVTDQSHARAVLRVSGRNIRDTLAKGFPIDLHPRAFAPGQVAITTVSHIGVTIWQVNNAPTYDLFVYRSLAKSFWAWLSTSAAEFGLEVA
jgi:sarcosine oxidase subunit gamma